MTSHSDLQLGRIANSGFTLGEVAISAALLTIGVLVLALFIPAGLKAQQQARFKLYAAAQVVDMIETFTNSPQIQKPGLRRKLRGMWHQATRPISPTLNKSFPVPCMALPRFRHALLNAWTVQITSSKKSWPRVGDYTSPTRVGQLVCKRKMSSISNRPLMRSVLCLLSSAARSRMRYRICQCRRGPNTFPIPAAP